MNIVFVSYMDFTGPGVIHMFHLANGLHRLGHRVLFLVNGSSGTVESLEEKPLFSMCDLRFRGPVLHPSVVRQVTKFSPQIIHLWTPRNAPARAGLELKYRCHCQLVIHYEDDEDILARQSDSHLFKHLSFAVDSFLHPRKWVWVHPFTYHWVNMYADALTVISPEYGRLLADRWHLPVSLLIPGVDLERFSPALPRRADLVDRLHLHGKKVLIYGGSIAQFYEFQFLLEAFTMVSEQFPDLVLLQYGRNFLQETIEGHLDRHRLTDRVHFLGLIPHHEVPDYLALGDILVQPGQNTDFNRHRLPSKIPEYMAMGRPVITFSCGIGEEFEHRRHAFKLAEGSPAELAGAIGEILTDPGLAETLARGSRERAEGLFSWPRSVNGLITTYQSLLLRPTRLYGGGFFDRTFSNPADLETMMQEQRASDKQSPLSSAELLDEFMALREFHRKVTSTIAYKLYFRAKLLFHWLRTRNDHDQDPDHRR